MTHIECHGMLCDSDVLKLGNIFGIQKKFQIFLNNSCTKILERYSCAAYIIFPIHSIKNFDENLLTARESNFENSCHILTSIIYFL